MKAIKVIVAILVPIAVLCSIATLVLDIMSVGQGIEVKQIIDVVKSTFENFSDFLNFAKEYGILMITSAALGTLILVLWIVIGCIRKHFSRIFAAIVAEIFLSFNAIVFPLTYIFRNIDGSKNIALADYAFYVGIACIALFTIGFILDIIRITVSPKKGTCAVCEKIAGEFEYNEIPPILSEPVAEKHEELPRALTHDSNHVEVGENFFINHTYLTESEIAALVAGMPSTKIPEENLEEYANILRKDEAKPEELPAILDPNFVKPENEGEDLPAILDPNFVPEKPADEPVDMPAILDPNFVPERRQEDIPNLPMFGEQFVPETIQPKPVSEPVVKGNGKPLHVSKNKDDYYQVKQVGDDEPLGTFETEEEAVFFARRVAKENGTSIRLHDAEGKIHSI